MWGERLCHIVARGQILERAVHRNDLPVEVFRKLLVCLSGSRIDAAVERTSFRLIRFPSMGAGLCWYWPAKTSRRERSCSTVAGGKRSGINTSPALRWTILPAHTKQLKTGRWWATLSWICLDRRNPTVSASNARSWWPISIVAMISWTVCLGERRMAGLGPKRSGWNQNRVMKASTTFRGQSLRRSTPACQGMSARWTDLPGIYFSGMAEEWWLVISH